MDRIRTTILVGVLIMSMAACGTTSEEGATVLLHVPDDPTVTFKVWFDVGSHDDPPGLEGLAYLTAQMIADGSTETRSLDRILDALYPLAAGYSARVDREMTVLTGRTHVATVESFFELLTDAYLRPAFTAEDFERLRSDTLNHLENGLRFQADEELGKASLYGFVFRGTGYAHPPEGTVQSVNAITLDDVKAFYAKHYTRDNVTLALGGGYDASLLRRFEDTRRQLASGAPEGTPASAAEPIDGLRVLLIDKPGADSSISFGFPIDARRGEREFYALWIANSWLGEHRNSSSHLYQVIREARGLNYGDYSYIEAFPGGGRRNVPPVHVGRNRQIFEVWIRTLPNDQAHFALRAAVLELKRLVDSGMTEQEFQLTRTFLRKYVLHFADTTSGRLGYAVDDRFYGIGDEGHLARFRKMMDEITLDEVNAAVRKFLQYENMKMAIVTGDAEGLRRSLIDGEPTPISYRSGKPPAVVAEDVEIAGFPLRVREDAVEVLPVDRVFEVGRPVE